MHLDADAIDADAIDAVCDALLDASERLRHMPNDRIIDGIDRAARRLVDPAGPARADILSSLVQVSGLSAPMAEHVLDRAASDWFAPALDRLLREELGGPQAIESFVCLDDGRRARAVAPHLALHVVAGNVPGVGVTSVIRSLLVRSAVIAKSAAAEPMLTPAFARALVDVDPELGACVAATYWPGGDTTAEDAVLARVGLVVHYGGAAAIAALRARTPAGVRFIEHGPRISFAVVRADGLTARSPHDLAYAVAVFDQQGCVSPQVAYVIGTRDQAVRFAADTADALAAVGIDLPRGRIDTAEAAAIRELRARAEFGAVAGRGGDLWAPADLGYSVILSDDPAFEGSCLNRTLIMKHVPDLATLLGRVAPYGDVLQTVGLDGFAPDSITHAAMALGDIGVTRVTAVADMPWPPPGWHHDGRGALTELIRWVDLDF